MQIFKKTVFFIAVNLIIVSLLTLMLAQPSVLKILLKEAKEADYDTIIIGQSHGETGYNPYILSDTTGYNVFNISRRLTPNVNLYYILREINKNEHYKRVIWDLDSSYWTVDHSGCYGTDSNLIFKLSGLERISYIKNVVFNDNYNDTFADFDFNLDNVKKAKVNIKCKLNKDYILRKPDSINRIYSTMGISEYYKYQGRGFRYGVKKSNITWSNYTFNKNKIKSENLQCFYEIIEYCKDKNIELICVISALPPYRLKNENYDDVHEYFNRLSSENNIAFYDLNYIKKEYFPRTDSDYVDLDGHMMGETANRQSVILGKILLSESKDDFFYDNYSEVVKNHCCL